jgi:hypothetical protein
MGSAAMLDFTKGTHAQQPAAGFTLNRAAIARARLRGLKKREWRLLITLPMAVMILVLAGQYLMGLRIPTGLVEQFPIERTRAPRPRPALAAAAPLATGAEIATIAPVVAELVDSRAAVRHGDDLDAATLAWAALLDQRDLVAPPAPQRVGATELMLGDVANGSAVLLSGRLEDATEQEIAGGGRTWQRLLVALDGGQYAQVLAGPEARQLAIGADIQLVGRHLGWSTLPLAEAGAAPLRLPLLLARHAARAPKEQAARSDYQGIVRMPEDLYRGLSDERLTVEERPYYYLLGQVAADRALSEHAYADAPKGNSRAGEIHDTPDQFRGQPFEVMGYVYRAWEDPEVARDHPWGIQRVVRVLLWHRDLGAVTEIVNGKAVVRTQILRLYELAMITDQPLPQRMDKISASGRFLKFHALPVQNDRERDRLLGVNRQSDRCYTNFFVTGGYTVIPPPPIYELGPWAILGTGLFAAMALLVFFMTYRDTASADAVGVKVRQIRSQRRQVREKEKGAQQKAAEGAVGGDPPAPPPA